MMHGIFLHATSVNGSSQIKVIDFDQSYNTVAHADSFIINITITDMHKITARFLKC